MIFRALRFLLRASASALLLAVIALLASLFFAGPGVKPYAFTFMGYKQAFGRVSAEWSPLPGEVLVALEHSTTSSARWLPHPVDGLIAGANAAPEASVLMRTHAAFAIALQLPMDDTLNWYGHTVDVGSRCTGFEAAATGLAGKPVAELSLVEASELAVLTLAPHVLADDSHRKTLRDAALARMAASGALTEAQANAAMTLPLMDLSNAPGC